MKHYSFKKELSCIVFILFIFINFLPSNNAFVEKSTNKKNVNGLMNVFSSDMTKNNIELNNINNGMEKVENANNSNSTYFDWHTIADLGQTAWGLSSADFNHDGNMDFAVSWATVPWTKSVISIFYNDGKGGFTRDDVYTITKPLLRYINSLTTGDFTNNGNVDIIFSYTETNESYYATYGVISILFNKGNNTFGDETLIARIGNGKPASIDGRYNPHLNSADFNMDNNLDLIVGDNSGKVEFYTNNGHGNFSSRGIIYDYGICSWGVTSADFNGDGDIDILVAAAPRSWDPEIYGFGQIYLKENQMIPKQHSPCFNHNRGTIVANFESVPGTASLTPLNYGNDGNIDFIAGIENRLYLYIFNNGVYHPCFICSLPPPEGYIEDLTAGSLTSADFNNDGKVEFIAGGVQGVVRFFTFNYSQPTGAFISKPVGRLMYFFNNEAKIFLLKQTVVFGKISVEVNTLGNISYVDFYVDGSLQFNDTTPPFEWLWDNASFGRHLLAIGYTAYGNHLYELRYVRKYF
jgi:hypothetical protein